MNDDALAGKAILIVEDEYVIATDLRQGLEAIGATVVGPAPSPASRHRADQVRNTYRCRHSGHQPARQDGLRGSRPDVGTIGAVPSTSAIPWD